MRAFWAIAKRAFRSSGSGGAKASAHAGLAMGLSALVVFCLIAAIWVALAKQYFFFDNSPDKIIIINAPDTLIEYIEGTPIGTEKNVEIIYGEHPYAFDIATYSSMMKMRGARVTIVFDKDGDILTFYPADDLENHDFKEDVIKPFLDDYSKFLSVREDLPVDVPAATEYFIQGMENPDGTYSKSFFDTIAFMFIPLFYFIASLYSSMMKGTNVIAGSKEQNTFAAILMTPVPRRQIILGNIFGVWMSEMIPAAVISLPLLCIPTYRKGVFLAFLIMAILSVFIASLVILISVLSSNVISAQTAFLPVFFVFVAVCISGIQNPEDFTGLYEYIPLYGQYMGIGKALTSDVDILAFLCSSFLTLLLAFICIMVSIKLLYSERFTVSVLSATDKELIKARKQAKADARRKRFTTAKTSVFGYKPRSSLNGVSFSLSQLLRPLVLLSVFQLIAMIPPLLMTNGEYLTNVIASLKAVKNVPDIVSSGSRIIGVLMSTPAFLLSMALGYILIDAYYCARVRFIERTSLASGLGLPREHIARRYLTGMATGLVLMGSVFAILLITGQIRVTGFGIETANLPLFFSFIVMWIFQGACEEIMFRGYMMPRVAARYGLIPAIAVSSLLFCLFHGLNPGFTVLALINLILVSVLFALIAYFTDNIWIVCAAHTMWNFTQGNVFGLEVSGNSGNVSLIHTVLGDRADATMTGGTFGPEGGLAVTVVTLIAIAAVLVIFRRRIKRKNA